MKRLFHAVIWAFILCGGISFTAQKIEAKDPPLPRGFYYPYYYFPASYWPSNSPQYPEPYGAPYMRPPAHMAYPPFLEPNWRYELWTPLRYYRGSHFWLDQF